jgi:hypothetical protein
LIVDDPECLLSVFSALGNNMGLKTLEVYGYGSMDESLCTAMNYGLELNETLESLELNVCLRDKKSGVWVQGTFLSPHQQDSQVLAG